MPRPDSEESRSPLLHPVAIAALALLVVNDHLLKAAWPGLITGKASDVAALILVPPLAVEIGRVLARGSLSARGRAAVATGAAILIAATFVAVKLHPVANEAYAAVLGLIQWPAVLAGNLLAGAPIAPPGRAPTVLDAGDLIALPAAAVGWWVGAGGTWRPATRVFAGARLQPAVRIGLLLGALFALGATSQSPPTQATAVAPDEVLLGSGQPSVERHAIVRIQGVSATGSIVIEARSRWPLVAPAPQFAVSREGTEPNGPAVSNRVAVDPATCRSGCDVPVVVVIDWPGSTDNARTSVAWELAATVRAGPTEYLQYGASPITIEGDGFASRQHGLVPGVLVLFAGVLGAMVLAAAGIPRPVHRRAVGSPADAVVLVAGIAIAALLVAGPTAIQWSAFEPAAGGTAGPLLFFGVLEGAAVVAGLVLWWRGNGSILATALLSSLIVALALTTRLMTEASATFAGSGLLAAAAVTAIATVALVGALRRPGRIGDRWVTPSRVLVAATGIATAIALLLASDLRRDQSELAAGIALIHLLALAIWWNGSGVALGVTSFLVGGGTVLRALLGPSPVSGPPWTAWDLVTIVSVCIGAAITLIAAFGGFARHASRPDDEAATRAAVAKAIAEREAAPPPG